MKPDTKHERDARSNERRSGTQIRDANVLVWLPSPMGDAILCTPALRAIRRHFESCEIWFYANPVAHGILSPSTFCGRWLKQEDRNPFSIAKALREYNFTHAILFKNSFASALAIFLAGIPSRIGYARECRGFLLTDKLHPPRRRDGRFKPQSMIDYYLAIASWLGADTADRDLELSTNPLAADALKSQLPELVGTDGPIVVIVPGGAFGPSKCWPNVRFAQTADWLIANYNATVAISVSPDPAEKQIAREICRSSGHQLINLAERPISLGELKALFSIADLVISNDTGPRHIAIALGRKLITLFGPNDPAWTDTGYESEIQIVGRAPCAPCGRPVCKKSDHLCMQAITVEMVCEAASRLLEETRRPVKSVGQQEFIETSKSFLVDADYEAALAKLDLTSIDAVFSFDAADKLTKNNLARFRSRLRFEIDRVGSPHSSTVFMKRYDRPPILVQLRNWLSARSRKSCSLCEFESTSRLRAAGINTPKTIAFGEQWGVLFEKTSFIITEEIPDAESLEQRLPDFFYGQATVQNLKLRRNFIAQLASFIREFHKTNYRHRDLYFAHIFYDRCGKFHLIDLARAFRPIVLRRRFQMKDIAQVHYSAPAKYFSRTDRLRFYFGYTGRNRLTSDDKAFMRKVTKKAKQMARRDTKYGRHVPFAN